MEKIEQGLIEVGDIIVIKNWPGTQRFTVTRVTKTLSLSKRDDGYEHRFKRKIQWDMGHPHSTWNTNEYTVLRPLNIVGTG